jgi:HAMP domain-containing protein
MVEIDRVIAILAEARELLALSGNDFAWSAWRNQEAALGEIDRLLRQLRAGSLPELSALFAPTGPIQEVSLSSGWGDRFLDLAERLDRELTKRG